MMRLCLGLALLAGPAVADVTFEDVSSSLPYPHVYDGDWEHFVGGGVAVFDCNDDARPDIAAAGGTNPARLFVNATAGSDFVFEHSRGFPEITGVTGLYPLDIDGDRIFDLVVLRVGANKILRGEADCRFTDAPEKWGFDPGTEWSTAFSATWEAGQEWPTLAIGNYVDRDDPEGPFGACATNYLHRPSANRRFARPTPLEPGYCALSMLFSDWARDGNRDLRVSNDRHYYLRGGAEQMWRLSGLRLLSVDEGFDPISIWGMGIASRDLNRDARPDVLLTSMGDQILQYATVGPGYDTAPYETGATAHRPFVGDDGRPSTGWHAEFGDVNNDGQADLFIAKGNVDQMPSNAIADPNNLLIQQSDGTFSESADAAGVASMHRARGASLADFDGDGRLDLVVTNRRAPMELYRNTTAETGSWIAVEPSQEANNRNAVGAWVEVRTESADPPQVQEVTVGGGHAGGRAGPLHFGIGTAQQPEIRVVWPDGQATDWLAVDPDQSVVLKRGQNGTAFLERKR